MKHQLTGIHEYILSSSKLFLKKISTGPTHSTGSNIVHRIMRPALLCSSFLQFQILIKMFLNGWTNGHTGWHKLKYPSSKVAISWQYYKILRPILQQLLSTNQWINPQNYTYISLKKDKFTVLQRWKHHFHDWCRRGLPPIVQNSSVRTNGPQIHRT